MARLALLKSKLIPEKKKPAMLTIKPKEKTKPEPAKIVETAAPIEQSKADSEKPKVKQAPKSEGLDTSALLKKKKSRDM